MFPSLSYMFWFIMTLTFTGIAGVLATLGSVKKEKNGKIRFTLVGYILIISYVVIIVSSIGQYGYSERSQDLRDSKLFDKYQNSLEQMQAKSDSNNLKVNTNITEVLGRYGFMLDTTNKRLIKLGNTETIKNDILSWDRKDETIRNITRLLKSRYKQMFPLGYKIFASNPNFKITENDTIFSNLLTVQIIPEVIFDYSKDSVHIRVFEKEVVDRLHFSSRQRNNTIGKDIRIPAIEQPVRMGGLVIDGRDLYFALLDNTPNDEIFIFGYRGITSHRRTN